MSSQKKRYLYHKLAKSVFWVALLFAVLTSALFFITELKRSSEKTVTMINQLLDTVESTAAIAAYSSNNTIGEDVLKGLLRNDIIHEVRLSNAQGLQLIQARTTKVTRQAEIIRTLYSPFGDTEVIGRLTAIPEAQYNLLEARRSALFSALNSSVLIGLTALIVLLMVRSSLSRPLMKVSDTLHAIKAGEQERLEPLPRNRDELGQLVEDINGLLETLQEKFRVEHTLRMEIEIIEQQLRNIFESTSAGIFLLDEAGKVLTANPTLSKVIKLPHLGSDDLLGQDFPELAFAEPELMRELMHMAADRHQSVARDLRLVNRGAVLNSWVHCLLSRQTTTTRSVRFEGVVYDITDRIATENRIRHEADHDSLTGLLRRQAAERQLIRLINNRTDRGNAPVLFLLDLDRFKEVNDSYGHDAGDLVLIEVAARMEHCVRASDIVARLGGDEFLIVLVNCLSPESARQIAGEIVDAIGKPIQLSSEVMVQVGISIGIALDDGRGRALDELYKAADLAMYEVKRQGRNGFAVSLADGTIAVGFV